MSKNVGGHRSGCCGSSRTSSEAILDEAGVINTIPQQQHSSRSGTSYSSSCGYSNGSGVGVDNNNHQPKTPPEQIKLGLEILRAAAAAAATNNSAAAAASSYPNPYQSDLLDKSQLYYLHWSDNNNNSTEEDYENRPMPPQVGENNSNEEYTRLGGGHYYYNHNDGNKRMSSAYSDLFSSTITALNPPIQANQNARNSVNSEHSIKLADNL